MRMLVETAGWVREACVYFVLNLFIYFSLYNLHSSRWLSSCGEWGLLCCGARASHCSAFSCFGAQALGCRLQKLQHVGLYRVGLVVVAHRLSCSGWHVESSGPEIEAVSLHSQVDCYPLYHLKVPACAFKSILDTLLTATYIHLFIHLHFITCSTNNFFFNVLQLKVEFLPFLNTGINLFNLSWLLQISKLFIIK